MLKFLRRARGRLLRNELLAQGANALCIALAALIVLLLAGAEILNWRWLLLAPACAAAVGVWRALRRVPPTYASAQLFDRRLDLSDTLSTAFHFSQCDPPAPAAHGLLQRADSLAESLDARKAAPYTMPRAAYPMMALFLIASSLFALRYAISRKLDWNAPMARLLQWNPLSPDRALAQNMKSPDPNNPADEQPGDAAEPGDRSRDAAAEKGRDARNSAESRTGKSASPQSKKDSASQGRQADDSETRDQAESAKPGAGQAQQEPGQGKQGERGAQAGAQQSRSDSPGIMDRLKDAVQSLLSRAKQPESGQPKQANNGQSSQSSGAQSAAKQRGDSGKQGAGQQSSQQGEADRMADRGDGDGNGAGKSDSESGEKRAGNGIGSADGDKAIHEAEQLAAMGKISEIFGKRAADLTGEATVEVQSPTQQLRTPYAQRSGSHAEGGAEIGRDEVPPALQAYVREYFAQVRKQRKK